MADENQNNQQEGQAVQQVLNLQRCYLKDASLEMPHAPAIFVNQPEEQPVVDIQFEVTPEKLGQEGYYQVAVRGTVTVKAKETVMFLAECKQAGIFQIAGFSEQDTQILLNVNCPAIVYPYLRGNVADLITRSSMPPVHLPEVNFAALYQQRLEQEKANAAKGQQQA
ncbi:MAG: protein-export chaperone SecB [Sutterellaceae bacterium]|nr:protein-export chaperone SecB [Sutterellaceae bacterium]MDD7442435.1 protein-export chaperone SecB [Sutterellaceae bacterium]MDY2868896.1 protein-export chaperone SecB [Mesosutterella sp.]